MPTLKAKPKKKRTLTKKARRAMTTATADKEHTSYNANSKENEGRGKEGGKAHKEGKPIEEMTHAEHKAYLIREAEENEKVNDEIYQRTVDDIPSTTELLLPTATTNDELRAKALEQTKAATAAGQVKKVPYRKDGKNPEDPQRDKDKHSDKATK